jgi:hypothetical protein
MHKYAKSTVKKLANAPRQVPIAAIAFQFISGHPIILFLLEKLADLPASQCHSILFG